VKRPAFQFYPSDWRKDSGLRLCSLAARGLWVELMCIAHESEEYGKLKQNGRGFSHKTLAKLVGLSPQTTLKLLKELEENGVFSRDEDGAIYSRRMVRDEELRKIRAEAGSKGGNPILLGNLVKQNGKQKPTPSSSSSSSVTPLSKPTPTLEEFLEWANRCSLPADIAEAWFDRANGRTFTFEGYWTDRDGRAITDWRREIASYAKYRAAKHAELAARSRFNGHNGHNGNPKPEGVWQLQQRISAAQAEISQLQGDPNNKEPVNPDTPWDRRLKPDVAKRISELKTGIAAMRRQLAGGEGVAA
jgi:DNA-binding Lrp family transcriptional regulator